MPINITNHFNFIHVLRELVQKPFFAAFQLVKRILPDVVTFLNAFSFLIISVPLLKQLPKSTQTLYYFWQRSFPSKLL